MPPNWRPMRRRHGAGYPGAVAACGAVATINAYGHRGWMDADSAATVVHDEVYSAGRMTSTRRGLPIRGRTKRHGSAYRFRAVSRERVSLRGPAFAISARPHAPRPAPGRGCRRQRTRPIYPRQASPRLSGSGALVTVPRPMPAVPTKASTRKLLIPRSWKAGWRPTVDRRNSGGTIRTPNPQRYHMTVSSRLLTINLRPNQTQRPFHPRVPSR